MTADTVAAAAADPQRDHQSITAWLSSFKVGYFEAGSKSRLSQLIAGVRRSEEIDATVDDVPVEDSGMQMILPL